MLTAAITRLKVPRSGEKHSNSRLMSSVFKRLTSQPTILPTFSTKNSHIFSCLRPMKQMGVLIAIRESVAFTLKEAHIDPAGELNNKPFTIVNLYAPNSHQIRFLKRLYRKITTIWRGSLMICGDHNLTPDYTIDTTAKAKRPPLTLQPFLNSEDVYDVWRCQHANERDYTFHSSRHNSYSRIDLILVDKLLLKAVSSSTIQDIMWSDHALVSITVVEWHKPSPAYVWRTKSRIFQMPVHTTSIANNLSEFFSLNNHSISDPAVLWYVHNAYIRGLMLQICAREKRQRTQKLNQLLINIKTLEALNKNNANVHLAQKLSQCRSDLRLLLIE